MTKRTVPGTRDARVLFMPFAKTSLAALIVCNFLHHECCGCMPATIGSQEQETNVESNDEH